jgi:hypothetical protein
MTIFQVIAILAMIESSNQPNAIGDNGKAIGILQIHRSVVKDVNRIYGTNYKWPEDCKDKEKAKDICFKYLSYYGKDKTPEQLARIWNGGPNGHNSKATIPYLKKFRKEAVKRNSQEEAIAQR